MMELAVGAHEAESGPDEGPLRSDVVQSRVGDHPGHSAVGGYGQQGDDRLDLLTQLGVDDELVKIKGILTDAQVTVFRE